MNNPTAANDAPRSPSLKERGPGSEALTRAIGKTGLVLLIINSIIGAGIFGLPAKVFALTGVYSLLAFVVCAAVVLVFILCFAEVSSRFEATGGPYLYVRTAFGPLAAFGTGWLLLLSRIFNYATLINLLVTYAAFFVPGLAAPWPRAIFIAALTAVIGWANYTGVRNTTRVSNFFTVAKLVPLALFIITGFIFFNGANFKTTVAPPALSHFGEAVLLLVFAFGGFESVLVASGEVKAPRQQIPPALLMATAVVALFYIGVQVAAISLLPSLASTATPLADAATVAWGPAGAVLISLGALFSITGTLNVLLFSGSRLLYAFGENGQLPSALCRLHYRYKTPGLSLLLTVLATVLVSIIWNFITALTIGAIIRVLLYAVVCATLIKLRTSMPQKASYHVRWGRPLAIIGLVLAVVLLSAATLKEVRDVGLCALAGAICYFLFNSFKKRTRAVEKT